jgi:hypothetical protein
MLVYDSSWWVHRNLDARTCFHSRVLFLSTTVMERQLLKFASVEVTATLTTYAVLILLVWSFALTPRWAFAR